MKVLYLGYWSATDSLTQSVIVPRLEVLAQKKEIQKIFFCSIERYGEASFQQLPKTEWISFRSEKKGNVLFTKLSDFTALPSFLKALIKKEKIDLVIANSPLAGGVCWLALRKIKIPLVVECFEPHAESMLESGVWKQWDPRYWALRYLEQKQIRDAWKLTTVSAHYSNKLMEEIVDIEKIAMLPNCLRIDDFRFDHEQRIIFRERLSFSLNHTVGIYVGKFGGIYYDYEAFELFRKAFVFFGDQFRLIVLSGMKKEDIINKLAQHEIDLAKIFVASVPHIEVANYLSAADFAFATIKPTPTRAYCCPVKDGEYWANGLPVLLEEGIGDDSDIIKQFGGGIIMEQNNPMEGFQLMKTLISKGREEVAKTVTPVAHQFRRFELVEEYYSNMVSAFKKLNLPAR